MLGGWARLGMDGARSGKPMVPGQRFASGCLVAACPPRPLGLGGGPQNAARTQALEHRSSIHAACCVLSVRRANTCKL